MKTITKVWLGLLAVCGAQLAAAGEIVRDYPLDRISDSTYVIHGPRAYPTVENQGFMNNPAFIVTDQGVIVVDPGSSLQAGRMLLKQMRTVTDKPVTHVFNTHVHGDHWLGNHAMVEAFPKAVLMAHPAMIAKAKNGEGDSWVATMDKLSGGFTHGTRAVIPEQAVADAEVLKINGRTFRIYAPGKAHSGTDIMIEFVEESVVFLGDNVLNGRIARMDDASFRGSIQACQVAIDLQAKHYVPGHGRSGDVSVAQNYKHYLQTLYTEVGQHYEQGQSDFEMKPAVVAKLGEFQDWNGFNDEVGKHISLALLETERAAFE